MSFGLSGNKDLAFNKPQGLVSYKTTKRNFFNNDTPLLFIITLMPLNYILRKCTAGYKLSRSQEKIKHVMYMDDIKQFAKYEK